MFYKSKIDFFHVQTAYLCRSCGTDLFFGTDRIAVSVPGNWHGADLGYTTLYMNAIPLIK